MKILESIWYYFRYGSLTKLYKSDPILDILLIYLKEVGIKNYTCDSYHTLITFNDGTKLNYWNVNKWYAWMSEGVVNFSNGKSYRWNHSMPSNKVLFYFKKYTREIEKQKMKLDYSEFLPIKILRKIKLQKISVFIHGNPDSPKIKKNGS